MRILLLILLAAGVSACATVVRTGFASQHSSACFTLDNEDDDTILAYLRQLVTTTNPEELELRDSIGLAAMPARSVSYVRTDRICAAALAVHVRNHPPREGAVVRQITLIRIGSTRYLLRDFYSRAGEFEVYFIYDEQFREIGGFVG